MNETVEKVKWGVCDTCGTKQKLTPARGRIVRHGDGCPGTGKPPRELTTAPAPRGMCAGCKRPQKLSRVTGDVCHHYDADEFCEGSGEQPTVRILARDLRRTAGPVVPAPEGLVTVTREEVAQICGVTIRTVTRWVGLGYLTRYEDSRGRVAYARVQAEAMNRFEPVE